MHEGVLIYQKKKTFYAKENHSYFNLFSVNLFYKYFNNKHNKYIFEKYILEYLISTYILKKIYLAYNKILFE